MGKRALYPTPTLCLGAHHPKRGTKAVRRANIMQRRAATIADGTKRRWW